MGELIGTVGLNKNGLITANYMTNFIIAVGTKIKIRTISCSFLISGNGKGIAYLSFYAYDLKIAKLLTPGISGLSFKHDRNNNYLYVDSLNSVREISILPLQQEVYITTSTDDTSSLTEVSIS